MELKFYLNENTKKTSDNQPDWRGKVVIDGVNHKIAGWNKSNQYGKSIACTLTVDTFTKGNGGNTPNDEDIPF